MTLSFSLFLESIVLVLALSVDAFVASFAYGTNKIKIPAASVAVINLICSSILVFFLAVGHFVSPYIPETFIQIFCFLILFGLGIVKLFDSSVKMLIQRCRKSSAKVEFALSDLTFILTVYMDPKKANIDDGDMLSPMEALSLGVALSLDSAAVGFGAGVTQLPIIVTLVLSFFIGSLAVMSGCFVGNKIAQKVSLNLSWLSGALLIVLAVMKFL